MGDETTNGKYAFSGEDLTVNPEELISYFTTQRTLFDELLESFDDTRAIDHTTFESYAQKEQDHAKHFESKVDSLFPQGIPKPDTELQHRHSSFTARKKTLDEVIQTLSMGLRLRWVQNIDITKRINEHYTKFMQVAQQKGYDPSSPKLYNHFVDSFNATLQNIPNQVQSLHFTTLDEKEKYVQRVIESAHNKVETYARTLRQFTEYYSDLQQKKEHIQGTIQKGKEIITSIQDTEKLITEEQESIADVTNELERTLQEMDQHNYRSFQHLLQVLFNGAGDVLENIVSEEEKYDTTLSHVLGAIDHLPLQTISSFKDHAQTYNTLQSQQTQLHTDVKDVLEELCAHFRGYHSLIEETEDIFETVKQHTNDLQQKHETIDRLNEKYQSLIALTAQKTGIPEQGSPTEYYAAFEQAVWNNVQSIITKHQLPYKTIKQEPKQSPNILTHKQLSSAEEEYAAHVASLILRFGDIEIAEEKFWKGVQERPTHEQTFYHLALAPTFESEKRKELETELAFHTTNQDTLLSYLQKTIDEHEGAERINAKDLQAIDKKIKKVLGQENYEEIYTKVQSDKNAFLQTSRYAHLVEDSRLRDRILLFEAYDQEATEAIQNIRTQIDISNAKTKSPLHMLYELLYPQNKEPTSHLFIRTKNDHETYLSSHNTNQMLHRDNIAAMPLFSDYGFPDQHYKKSPKTGRLEKAQFLIDLRRLALVTYYITTTQHRWLNAKEITNAYLDDFRAHKTKPLYDEINTISAKIGTHTRRNRQDRTIDDLEQRREQLHYEAQKYEQSVPKGIYYSPLQRFYYHLSQHLLPANNIQYKVVHPRRDAKEKKLRLYDRSFREIHNKIDDRMTLKNIHSREQIPETDLRIITETLQQYI
jgi:ABC-type transporter Mla subunit MlaD